MKMMMKTWGVPGHVHTAIVVKADYIHRMIFHESSVRDMSHILA